MLRALAIIIFLLAPVWAAAQDFSALRAPGAMAIMRHALAPGTDDPTDFTLGDCSTQRNLDDRGRAQARRIGDALRQAGIGFDAVWSSQWCRCTETAREMKLGQITEMPPLNSFFRDRARATPQTEALLDALRGLPGQPRLMMVTHQVNIRALTGVTPRSGEIVVIRLSDEGGVEVLDRVAIAP